MNIMRNHDIGLHNLCEEYLEGKKDLIGIEIGSYAGQSAQLFLNTNAFNKLYCIDPWKNGFDDKDSFTSSTVQIVQKYFDERFVNQNRIIKIKDYSSNIIDKFADESIDFIYIDGNHRYQYVKEDLKNYYPKIKKGGIISGHDYNLSDYPQHIRGVKIAIDEFFKKSPLKIFSDTSWVYIK